MNPWLLLIIPLASAIIITLVTRGNKALSSYISIGAIVLCFVISIPHFLYGLRHPHMHAIEQSVTWLNIPGLYVELGTLIDPLSLLMLFIVTFVGSLIHIYSRGYMHGEPGFSRFFACLSLFIFSMLGIVLSNNFIQIFIFWELVGLASYLLIGYYFEKPSAADASKKAFLVNRIGDFGFILGIFVIFVATGTFNFGEIEHEVAAGHVSPNTLLLGALLLFCGAMGKSAQFPLHVWLPDAMEGPTPVSALIHAATMVAAGVYMLARIAFILNAAPPAALMVIAYIGGITALMAACIALAQSDIKRVVAYSTLSSLGYMVMAVGVGSVTAGMFYLTTHGFFKALLFLAAGSAIHAVHSNEIWDMGNLYPKMKITAVTFILGAAAMSGVFPFSGFWSKDEILSAALSSGNYILFFMGILAAFISALFMAKLCFVAFFGKARYHGHPHESPPSMTIPLIILAFFAVVSGAIGLPWLETNFGTYIGGGGHGHGGGHGAEHFSLFTASLSTIVVLAGIGFGYQLYYKGSVSAHGFVISFPRIHRALVNKLYFDHFYDTIVVGKIYNGIARLVNFIEVDLIIKGGVNGLAYITRELGKGLRLSQTGKVQHYAFIMIGGVLLLLLFFAVG
ncbi:MAG: NADH-quinone oxidoreductase subunit L [Thermodesulfobacteriota bacterium]